MIIQSKRVYLHGHFIAAQIEITDDKITGIFPYNHKGVDVDYDEKRIVPGFIDVHIHGAYGVDTNDADEAGLKKVMQGLVSEGVTSFLPTTVTQSKEVLLAALKNVVKVKKQKVDGTQILGIHFEGPYLDMDYKGAQPGQYIVKPSVAEFKEYEAAAEGLIKIITIAPEKDDDFALVKYLASKNIVASIGHSAATYDEVVMAVANGARSMTHVFNGMTGIHHRNYGIAGAAHRLAGVYGEIIADGNHVIWPVIHDLMMAKGKFHNVLITDALNVKGSPMGEYNLGGQAIEVKANGSAYIKGTDRLSGSTLNTNKGVRNLVEYAQVPIEYAINAATINPATLIGVDDVKGKLQVGYDADIVVLEDDYDVNTTYVLGKVLYTK
ncbi:MAG: N-acetylglucosamine-6-phosphate deacetylase [Erysipelothrix sp.]|jgi:N-acetylglucosamine-6-phosphate deacetylase|nr:N-acetylglucosamine-6-phosphate deacetylase [Erysipelothrix sp.]